VTKIDGAVTAKDDEAEAVKADERATLVDTGKTAAEAASMSPQIEDQLGSHGREREVYTLSSDEPPGHMERG
jgi:hypothetical protein